MDLPILPTVKSISTLILDTFGSTLSGNANKLVQATTQNLENEYVTLNELYNMASNALPKINEFFDNIAITQTLKDTFKSYTLIWLPYQYAVLIALVTVTIIILMATGALNFAVGVWIILGFATVACFIAVLEINCLINYLNNSKTTFENKAINEFNAIKSDLLLDASLGYLVGSQLTMNGPPGPTGSPPGYGPIPLTDPTQVYRLLSPYYKVTLFQTYTPVVYTPQPAIFNVLLTEPELAVDIPSPISYNGNLNTVKLQYGKIIYIINANYAILNQGLNPVNGDTGIINIINASTTYPNIYNPGILFSEPSLNINYSGSLFDPPSPIFSPTPGLGVPIYPGECKCFLNVGYNQNLTGLGFTGVDGSVSTWMELTADIRPFTSIFNPTPGPGTFFPRPTTKIMILQIPNGTVADFTTNTATTTAIINQELFLIASPVGGGTLTVKAVDINGNIINKVLINAQNALLTFQVTAGTPNGGWVLVYPS